MVRPHTPTTKRTRGRFTPSPAMAVAMLALLVALGGTSYAATRLPANSVTAKELKRGAVTKTKIRSNAVDGSKVAADSLTGADINEATLQLTAAARAASADHAGAAAALDKLFYRTATGAVGAAPPPDPAGAGATAHGAATALCDAGQHAVGGGVRVDDADNTAVVDSWPDGGGTAWSGRVDNSDPAAAHGFTVFAICASAVGTG